MRSVRIMEGGDKDIAARKIIGKSEIRPELTSVIAVARGRCGSEGRV